MVMTSMAESVENNHKQKNRLFPPGSGEAASKHPRSTFVEKQLFGSLGPSGYDGNTED